MTPKYEIDLLFTEVKTTYHVHYINKKYDEDDEYIVVKTCKFNKDTWEIFPIDSPRKLNKSLRFSKQLINFCKKLWQQKKQS